jgi:hypothetical protein
MGYGNVTRSLDLANRQLASQGITNPTASQLKAALNGGTVATPRGDVRLDGVLALRRQGMGWGKIAHTIGVPPSGKSGPKTVAHSASGAHGKPGASRAPGPGSAPGSANGAQRRGNSFNVAGAAPGGSPHGPMGGGGGGHGRGR